MTAGAGGADTGRGAGWLRYAIRRRRCRLCKPGAETSQQNGWTMPTRMKDGEDTHMLSRQKASNNMTQVAPLLANDTLP